MRHILLNERYCGVVIWGKTKKLRSPETGKRIHRHKPENEWRKREVPEQRIVSEELWNRTHERLKLVQELYGVREGKRRGRAAASPYLFTGLLECECGSITIVSGRCHKREDSRMGVRCTRSADEYTLHRFEEELAKALASRSQGDADLRRQAAEIERGIANQLRALNDLGYSPAITKEIARLRSISRRFANDYSPQISQASSCRCATRGDL